LVVPEAFVFDGDDRIPHVLRDPIELDDLAVDLVVKVRDDVSLGVEDPRRGDR
jgi:hypothetical protein